MENKKDERDDPLSLLIFNARKRFLERPDETCKKYIEQISEYLKLTLRKDGLVCIVSVPEFKPTENFDRIIYVDMEWFNMIIPQLQKHRLRLVERTYICTHREDDCGCKPTKTGYNIYIC